ncbi:MAG: TetR/AcrR family transcriptional regulator [Ilumatobacter sp.]|uniref:TetR/AcrR family transcriptional regulator n=1 Tax=Ilumatobacter sp. TaxID=1967498 RepID=UPI003299FDBE
MSAAPIPRRRPSRRIGRPPDTDSAETRQRILDRARVAFATDGFDAATNRSLADDVGVTAGALYHYFGSKLDLYLAVDADVQRRVYVRMNEAVDAVDGFFAKFEAVLDVARELNAEDPSLATFLGARRTDIRRHPEIAAAMPVERNRERDFFARIVAAGVDAGEIADEHSGFVTAFVATLLTGLTDSESHDPQVHARAIEAIKLVLHGRLFSPD